MPLLANGCMPVITHHTDAVVLQPHFFGAFCFGLEGIYRLWWSFREDRPLIIRVTVALVSFMSILLVPMPRYPSVQKALRSLVRGDRGDVVVAGKE